MYECDFVERVCKVVCPNEKYVKLHKVYKLVEEKFTSTSSAKTKCFKCEHAIECDIKEAFEKCKGDGVHNRTSLDTELRALINCHNAENGSDTPDYILASYLVDCLNAFDRAVNARETWHGRKPHSFPDSSFIYQRGVYTHESTTTEESRAEE